MLALSCAKVWKSNVSMGGQTDMPTYLVTGGAGFIGSNIIEQLISDGADVRVIDNLSTGRRENLEPFEKEIDFREVDICDLPALQKAVVDCDIIFHQAAIPSVPKSVVDPITSHNADVTGTLHVLWAAREAGVKRVVYAASSSAYGDSEALPKREDMPPRPISPYGLMKYVGEEYCRLFTLLYGLETVSLRYFNVFGPRQDPTSQYSGVLSRFITTMLRGEHPVIFGDGEQSRDFTYVSNVVSANLQACRSPKAAGRVYNVACGTRITLKEVVRELNRILGTNLDPVFAPPRAGDIRHSMADIHRAADDLGYSPQTDFENGLVKTVEWYRKSLKVGAIVQLGK
jgi:UDP-glucose 4-epimerase